MPTTYHFDHSIPSAGSDWITTRHFDRFSECEISSQPFVLLLIFFGMCFSIQQRPIRLPDQLLPITSSSSTPGDTKSAYTLSVLVLPLQS